MSTSPATAVPKRVLMTGASGLVGSALSACLVAKGQQVVPLVRRPPRPGSREIEWDPVQGRIDVDAFQGVDAIVNLAGENIAAGRWTASRKKTILESRLQGTRLLAEAMTRFEPRPRAFISASAVGYYGHRGEEQVSEDSPAGCGFLAEVCRRWEQATTAARDAGVRVVLLRLGIVLSARGGALARMLTPAKLGLGGPFGSGCQWMSWIGLTDLVRCVEHLLANDVLSGPVNAVSPHPVTNAEFAATLGKVLGRPAILRMPAMAVNLLFGEMGRELLLASTRAEPSRLLSTGFCFAHPDLTSALRAELSV
ncbi:MAG TPA: TIGR01777 family oxidoreductase [Phycisphaerae bacterium]|nr:TIGR01777 family oxidoreductase [Phycisphaerae bacterium]HRY68957.1 TIGR01777 family oxidoreductase [Phycisphaerae bacterium]HSA25784.1 TIGR01777 family oxidoreductase [Phycisphaerae bacterium]